MEVMAAWLADSQKNLKKNKKFWLGRWIAVVTCGEIARLTAKKSPHDQG